MTREWISVLKALPEDGERVLCWLPDHDVYLPGKTGEVEVRNLVILKFAKEFFLKNPSKTGKARGIHFWLGEGTSNHFFEEVSHWRRLPEAPGN